VARGRFVERAEKTIGIDATTLDANAALRSIVRRDTGESHEKFLTRLAQASDCNNLIDLADLLNSCELLISPSHDSR
jgi:hypothetical protein